MTKLPLVVGLTLCEKMEVDAGTGKVSLVGIFQGLHSAAFPSTSRSFTVYAALYDGIGQGRMEVEIVHLQSEQDVFSLARSFTFPGRYVVLNLVIPVTCVFPASGKYSLALRLDDEVIAQRTLEVFQD